MIYLYGISVPGICARLSGVPGGQTVILVPSKRVNVYPWKNPSRLQVGGWSCGKVASTMKTLRAILITGVAALAVYGFGRFFLSQLSSGDGASRSGAGSALAAVMAVAPPGFSVAERGALSPAQAAGELADLLAASPPPHRVGIKFHRAGATLYWLADGAADTLEERAAGAAGTRLATLWPGGLRQRLLWGRSHGDLAAPGLPGPERKNLYH